MTLPLGYQYAATYARIRKNGRDDLGLIVSSSPASAAAVFTTNLVQAASVKLGRRHLEQSGGIVRAVVVNAGNANCATRTGEAVVLANCTRIARELNVPVEQVFPSSTGVIGVELDPALINDATPALVRGLTEDRFFDVACAIMTTDTRMKVARQEVPLQGGAVRIAGMTKGSGMIHPNMATTLGFVMLDAVIAPEHLRPMLSRTIARSYNRLSVDGDMSTNDTVLVLANGASGIAPNEKERAVVEEVLCWVLEDLAEQIARDGEGARKLITVTVRGAASDAAAETIARSIANSPLVKTAIAGSDPNWGRILCAAGYAGVPFDPGAVDIDLQRMAVCRSGLAADFNERDLKRELDAPECTIRFTIRGEGVGQARFWTCDLTEKYIEINASYRT